MVHNRLVTIAGGLQIAVPDSLESITTYVLLEQNDFFERELPFVRKVALPGDHAIDIGANYGVYTLSLARAVGPLGRIWAFEPGPTAADCLETGVTANHFEHVTVVRKAVSRTSGSAFLTVADHAELRSLTNEQAADGQQPHEPVSTVTLDDCMESYGWRDIAFIKIDAEGAESDILKGARNLLAAQSPLIQYEIRAGSHVNLDLVNSFLELDYSSYRLVPALDLLVPFDFATSPDPYLLNLYCCKPSRGQQLAERGLLIEAVDSPAGKQPTYAAHAESADEQWRNQLAAMPYAAALRQQWMGADCNGKLAHALAAYVSSRDYSIGPGRRFGCLRHALLHITALCRSEPSYLRLLTLSRIAADFGARAQAVHALTELLARLRNGDTVTSSEPFLAPSKRFELLNSGDDFLRWVIAGVLEQLESMEFYSSFYAGPNAEERLQDIKALGLGSPEMDRRLELIKQRFASHPRSA